MCTKFRSQFWMTESEKPAEERSSYSQVRSAVPGAAAAVSGVVVAVVREVLEDCGPVDVSLAESGVSAARSHWQTCS